MNGRLELNGLSSSPRHICEQNIHAMEISKLLQSPPTKSTWLIVGASRGIGLEFVKQALAKGDKVVATARAPQKAAQLWELAGPAPRGACQLLLCDVSSGESINVRGEATLATRCLISGRHSYKNCQPSRI